jgi:hypothetical protein
VALSAWRSQLVDRGRQAIGALPDSTGTRVLRLAAVGLVAALQVVVIWRLFLDVPSVRILAGFDYWVFAAAGRAVATGHLPYTPQAMTAALRALSPISTAHPPGGAFAYMPWVAVVLVPFGLMPYWLGFGIWSVVSLGLLVWCIDCWWRWLRPSISRWAVQLAVLVSFPALSLLRLGQIDAFVLGIATLGFALHRRQMWFWVGVLAVVGFSLKPQALLWLPFGYLLLAGGNRTARWRGVAGMVAAAVAVVILPLALNRNAWDGYFKAVLSIGKGQPDIASLAGFVRWFPALNGLPIGLSSPVTDVLLVLGLGVIAAWVGRVLISPRWQRSDPTDRWVALVAFPLLIWLASAPYLHDDDLVLILPIVMWGLSRDHLAVLRPVVWLVLIALVVDDGIQGLVLQFLPRSATPAPAALLLALITCWLWVARPPGPAPEHADLGAAPGPARPPPLPAGV